jgi:phosphoglycerate dehydrogenase-like enzyme
MHNLANTMTAPLSARPRIAVLADAEQALLRLGDWGPIHALADVEFIDHPPSGDALIRRVRDADCLVLMRDRVPLNAQAIGQLPKLRYLVFTGTRNTTLDLAALQAQGVTVGHTEWGPSKDSTCEMTWALVLGAVRQLEAQTARLRAGQWRAAQPQVLGGVLHGETLGLIGLGEIGGRVARVGQAFGMRVLAWSPNLSPERAAPHGVTAVDLETLLEQSKVLSLHLVPSAQTRHLLNAERLARMRADAILVNTSRSALIDHAALCAALQAGRPGLAALDVFDTEPLPLDDPLRQLPNALLTPHLGFVTEPVFARFAEGVCAGLLAWLRAEKPPRMAG